MTAWRCATCNQVNDVRVGCRSWGNRNHAPWVLHSTKLVPAIAQHKRRRSSPIIDICHPCPLHALYRTLLVVPVDRLPANLATSARTVRPHVSSTPGRAPTRRGFNLCKRSCLNTVQCFSSNLPDPCPCVMYPHRLNTRQHLRQPSQMAATSPSTSPPSTPSGQSSGCVVMCTTAIQSGGCMPASPRAHGVLRQRYCCNTACCSPLA